MSGKVVPATGPVTLRAAPASASNAIFEVFGKPAGNNLIGLVGSNVDTGVRPPPFVVASTVPTAASGNLKMSFFRGKSVFLTSPNAPTVSTITTTSVTPTLSGGGGTSYQISMGSAAGGSNTVGWISATSGTAIAGQAFTQGSSYYISAYSSNAANSTASLAISNSSAFGIPNAPATPTITLTSLTSWSLGWTAPSGIPPTSYSWVLCNTSVPSTLTSGSTASTTVSGTTTLTQANNYAVYVSSVRAEASSGTVNSTNSSLAAPSAPTTYTVSSMTTSNYTPNVSGGSGSYYVNLGTSSGGTAPSTLWSSGAITQTLTAGTNYYLTAITSNTTTGTKSAQYVSSAVGIPNAVTSLVLTITSLTNWSFSWSAGSGISPSSYNWSLVNQTTSTTLTSSNTTSTSVSGTTTLTAGNTYYASVTPVRPEATGSALSSTGVPAPAALPSPPTNLVTTGWTDTSSPVLTVTWTNASGATSYTIQLFISTTTYTDGSYPTTPNYTITNAQSGYYFDIQGDGIPIANHMWYFVRVFSVNANGTSTTYRESTHAENLYH